MQTIKPFTSSYTWEFANPTMVSIFSKINYENSIIGKRTLSAVTSLYSSPYSATWSELSSDGLLNFYTDSDGFQLIVVKNVIILLEPTTTNAATCELVKKIWKF